MSVKVAAGPAIEAFGLTKEFERGRRTIWQRIRRIGCG
jgi:hypothetical protein